MLINFDAKAHAVQVGYCNEGNGTITVWIEHWHSTENPATVSANINITINGITTTFIGSPTLSIQNTPKDSLPNCINMFNIMGVCLNQADSFNDWFGFQFTGLPSNVPITITVVLGNTTAVEDGCGMYPISSNTIILTTSVAELNEIEKNIILFPNPSNGIFNINIDPSFDNQLFEIEVFDLLGNKIESLTSANTIIDLSNSLKGIYFVKIISENNEVIVKKIILN